MASILFNIARTCNSQLKCNYLKNEKHFLNFLFHFWNLQQILNILRKEMIAITNVFPILQTAKNLVRPLCEKRRFRTPFDSQHVKVSLILTKSPREHFYHVFSSFLGKLIWKMSPLMLGKILGVFVNTYTADGKYPVQYCENLQFPIPTQLSEKRKTFSQFFVTFPKATSNFKHFGNRMMVIANVFPILQTLKNFLRPLHKKQLFGTPFESQHGKVSRILAIFS